MELLSVIVALESLKKEGNDVVIYSDSKYVVDAVEQGWVFNWAKKGFAGKKNADLWTRFLKIYAKQKVRFIWVKGHASNKKIYEILDFHYDLTAFGVGEYAEVDFFYSEREA
jgi:ribonuclease HI